MDIRINDIVFLCITVMTVLPCLFVVLSRNILYSAFALFFTFLGTSGLYFFIGADFLAITQVIIYIGGVSVILLFAILLTRNIDRIKESNAHHMKRLVLSGIGSAVLLTLFMYALTVTEWTGQGSNATSYPDVTVKSLGQLLLTKYLLPFEVVSILLLAVLVGSLVIASRSVR